MKYLVQRRLRNFAIATTLIGSTVANSATVFATPIANRQGNITKGEDNGRDLSGFATVTPNVPVVEESGRDLSGFGTLTPTVPVDEGRDISNIIPKKPTVKTTSNSAVTLNSTTLYNYEDNEGNLYTYTDYEDGILIITITLKKVSGEVDLKIPEKINGRTVLRLGYAGTSNMGEPVIKYSSNDILINLTMSDSVKEIHKRAFKEAKIKSVVIGNGVKTIDEYAFTGTPLEFLDLGSSVETIGQSAFRTLQGAKLNSVIIPESVTTIGEYAFENCGVQNLTLGKNLKTISQGVFAENKLKNVVIPSNVEIIGSAAFYRNSISSLEIPSNVKTIGVGAFAYNSISSLDLGKGVETIGDYAFEQNQLKTLVIPDCVKTIGNSAFMYNFITDLDLGKGVKKIGNYAFADDFSNTGMNISKLVIPDSVLSIGDSAFSWAGIKTLVLGGSVEKIGADAFVYNSIERLYIPKNIKEIGGNAFSNNPLVSVIFQEGSSYQSLDWYVFNNWEMALEELVFSSGVVSAPRWDRIRLVTQTPKYAIVDKADETTPNGDQTYTIVTTQSDYKLLSDEKTELGYTNVQTYYQTEYFRSSRTEDTQAWISWERYERDVIKTQGSLYRDYEVKLVDFKELGLNDVTFEDGSTSLSALSFISVDEGMQLLNDNIPVKEGYEFSHWLFRTSQGLKTLQLDGDAPAKYIVGDLKGVKPIFVPESSVDPSKISFDVDEAAQFDAVSTEEDASIAIYSSSTSVLTPGQVIDIKLDDGYSFIIGEDFDIDTVNTKNGFEKVTEFSDTNTKWEYIIYENYISIKVPVKVELKNPLKRFGIVLSNFGIEAVDTTVVPTTTREINVTVVTNDNELFSKRIATLEFERKVLLFLNGATKKNDYETEKDGSIAIVSNMKYSINDNQTFIIDLDDGFQFTHNYKGNMQASAEEFEFINTYAEGVRYVPSVADLRDDSLEWQFTTSDDSNIIYVKTPTNLHGNAARTARLSTKSTKSSTYDPEAGGVGFRINGIGIRDVAGEQAGIPRTVGLTVTTATGFQVGGGEFGELVPTNTDGDTDVDNGGGNSGGNGNITTPTDKETPVYEEVTYQPYISGYADGSVRANSNITRAEVAGIVYNIYGNGQAGNMANLNVYTDLKTNVWYSEAVAYCLNNGIFVGYDNNVFKPNAFITREELAAVLNRLNVENTDSTQSSSDVYLTDIKNSWAKNEIEELVARGIVFGYPDGEFKLKNYTTRGEFIALMNRTIGRPAEYKVENTFNDLESGKWYYEEVMNASNIAFKMVLKEVK